MWQHNYVPVAGSLAWSAVAASVPILMLLYLLGVRRKPAWVASLAGLAAAAVVAAVVYRMPPVRLVSAVAFGAAFGLFPIGYVVFAAILLYRIVLDTGNFEILKDSVGSLTTNRCLQALLIAFCFGAFIEGAAGFGVPVAVAAAMLAGLGFSPLYAATICLLANTAPVAYGSIGIPVVTLSVVTGLPLARISACVGRICAPISLFIPGYLIAVMGGRAALASVLPAAAVCGISFALTQFLVSNYIGPQITDILSSLAAIGAMIALLKVWKPKSDVQPSDVNHQLAAGNDGREGEPSRTVKRHTNKELFFAWGPYVMLVVFVLVWGISPVQAYLNKVSIGFPWPGLHNLIERMPPVTVNPSAYAAVFNFNWLSASGTACLFAAICSALLLRLTLLELGRIFWRTLKQLALAELTIAAVLALAYLMNYAGAIGTLGLAFAATGLLFPFFGPILGWLGVFLTGSDTSANALFGNLQVVTAQKLHMNPILMASANSSGGVMGKMISLQNIAVAATAAGLKSSDEASLFRFTLKHSIFLATMIGLIVVFYAYVAPQLVP